MSLSADVFLLRGMPYYVRDSIPASLACAALSMAVSASGCRGWQAVPDETKGKWADILRQAAKRLRRPRKVPGLEAFLAEKTSERQKILRECSALAAFMDRNDPVIRRIMDEYNAADAAFIEAYGEIRYARPGKGLNGRAGTMTAAVDVMAKDMRQLSICMQQGIGMPTGMVGRNGSTAAGQGEAKPENDPGHNEHGGSQRGTDQHNQEEPFHGHGRDNNGEKGTAEGDGSAQGGSFDFFAGCASMSDLKKRYRDLMKSFHPDGDIGDEESVKKINEAYEKAKSRFA